MVQTIENRNFLNQKIPFQNAKIILYQVRMQVRVKAAFALPGEGEFW